MKRKKNKLKLLSLLLVLASNQVYSQTIPKLRDSSNQFIIDKALEIDKGGGIIYYKSGELHPGEIFTTYYNYTGLGNQDSIALVETTKDSLLSDSIVVATNLFHNKYQQYYKGIEVEGGNYFEHHDGNCVWYTSGFLVEGLQLNTNPQINETSALNYAVEHINCNSYSWDSTGNYPIGKLSIIPTNNTTSLKYKLTWKFQVIGYNPLYYKTIYVNASTGVIENEISDAYEYGDFKHINYNQINNDLDTKRDVGLIYDDFYLFANDDSRNIYTIDSKNDWNVPFLNWEWDVMPKNRVDDNWGEKYQRATSAHYCTQKAWDFYNKSFANRRGPTGWGKHIRVHGDWDWQNAGWSTNPIGLYLFAFDNDHMLITQKNGKTYSVYDVIGHEFTHGVIKRSNQLPMQQVSGAINESFADIFGLMVERYAKGGIYNWTCGEDAMAVRDMQNPNNYGDPSYYRQSGFWMDPMSSTDDGGVHHNSGVQNKWFYLLSMGGSQEVFGQTRTVGGIGLDKASWIAYLTMTKGFNYDPGFNYDFEAVRASSIAAARQLFGLCSYEYNQTCAAWYAVNVGSYCEPCSNGQSWCGGAQQLKAGINERKNEILNFKFFPNPANDKITLLFEEINLDLSSKKYEVSILTMEGKEIYKNSFKSTSKVDIDIKEFISGIYIININNENWSKNIKFVKQ